MTVLNMAYFQHILYQETSFLRIFRIHTLKSRKTVQRHKFIYKTVITVNFAFLTGFI